MNYKVGEMIEGKVDQRQPFSYRLIEKWQEWKEAVSRSCVWTTRDGESMLLSGMKTGHIKNALALLKKANTPKEIKDGVSHSIWMEIFEKELQYREWKDSVKAIYGKKENKENKEDIEMSNTDLIEHKLREELEALDKAEEKETKDKFYETPIGKTAKAFNEALEKYGNEDQKDCDIDEDQLMELNEDTSDIRAEYDAKRQEVKEYYAEALSLFENADTYEQKHEILTSYGILKGPKAKAKVEAK